MIGYKWLEFNDLEELFMLIKNYGLEDDDNLAPSGIELKQEVLDWFETIKKIKEKQNEFR